jgi:hypothetical protein
VIVLYRIKSNANYIIHFNKINKVITNEKWVEITNAQFEEENMFSKHSDIIIFEQFVDPRDDVNSTVLTINDISSDINFTNDTDKIPTRNSVRNYVSGIAYGDVSINPIVDKLSDISGKLYYNGSAISADITINPIVNKLSDVSGKLYYNGIAVSTVSGANITNISQLVNDAGFIKLSAIAGKADKLSSPIADNMLTMDATGNIRDSGRSLYNFAMLTDIPSKTSQLLLDNVYTKIETDNKLSLKANVDNLSIVAISGNYNDLINNPIIPTVSLAGTTGKYSDLIGKPTIPVVPTLSLVAISGEYGDLNNKPIIPTNLSMLPGDSTHRLVTDVNIATWNQAIASGINPESDYTFNNVTVSGDILPINNGTQDIGSPTNRFRTIYVDEARLSTNTLYIGDTAILGTLDDTISIKADTDQSIVMKTSGIGTTSIISQGQVSLSTSGMNANVNIQATGVGSSANIAATNQVNFNAPNINFTGSTSFAGNTNLDNLTVSGNVVFNGPAFNVEATTVRVADNIMELNKNEIGNGVTTGTAGLKINRGNSDAYWMIFDEVDDMFKVGLNSSLQTIASQNWVNSVMYIHPSTHPASMIISDSTHRLVTDEQINSWNLKATSERVTQTTDGVMFYTDKIKIDNIYENATNVTASLTNGNIVINGIETKVYDHSTSLPATMITGLAVVAKSGIYSDLSGKPTIPTKTSDLINDSNFMQSITVPTKTSQLTNDSNFVTTNAIPINISQLSNDSNFITISSVPNKTSQLTNDSSFVTINSVPTKVSQLVNDSNFVTINSVPTKTSQLVNDSNFVTINSVPTKTSQLVNDSNFVTINSVPTKTSQLTNDSNFITNSIIDIDNTLILNSDVKVPSQKAIKSYVDNKVVTVSPATISALGTIQLTGDLMGSATNPQLTDIIGLTPGNYTNANITVDSKGRIITASNGTGGTGGTGSTINDSAIIGNTTQTYSADKILTLINAHQIEIDQLFQFANNAKINLSNIIGTPALSTDSFTILNEYLQNYKITIADNLINKGILASASDSIGVLTSKINQIVTNSLVSQTKLNVSAPYTKVIALTNETNIVNLCQSVIQFIPGASGIVQYNCEFNNTDSTNFDTNANVVFDGTIHLIDKTISNNFIDNGVCGSGKLWYCPVDKTKLQSLDSFTFIDDIVPNLSISGTNLPQLLLANGNIDLTGISQLTQIIWNPTISGTGIVRLIMSFNSGTTWYGFDSISFNEVNVSDLSDVKLKGMTASIANAMSVSDIESMRNQSNILKFGYYIEKNNINDVASNNNIQIIVSMPGSNSICDSSKYTVNLESDNKTITYNFNTSGTYTINYVDNLS